MTDAPSAYPLAWPAGFPRTPKPQQKSSPFRSLRTKPISVAEARKRLQIELDRIGARHPVISSNLELRLDGQPRSGQSEPTDPGVAVYFQLKGKATAMPCDRYTRIAGNIAAVAAHIAATRAIERHGVGTMEQMFAGFQAIRGPGPKPWREVLGIKDDEPVTTEAIQARRRELARRHHPDVGGSDAAMAEINDAAERALEEIANG